MNEDKLSFFIRRTEKDMDEIKSKLDKLWTFRLLLLGGAAAVSSMVTILVNVFFIFFKYKQ